MFYGGIFLGCIWFECWLNRLSAGPFLHCCYLATAVTWPLLLPNLGQYMRFCLSSAFCIWLWSVWCISACCPWSAVSPWAIPLALSCPCTCRWFALPCCPCCWRYLPIFTSSTWWLHGFLGSPWYFCCQIPCIFRAQQIQVCSRRWHERISLKLSKHCQVLDKNLSTKFPTGTTGISNKAGLLILFWKGTTYHEVIKK